MKFVSTRDNQCNLSFEEALFCCYTKDGGLLMPEYSPKISLEDLKSWKQLNYVDIVKKVVALFVSEDEVPLTSQHEILERAFKKFDSAKVVEIANLKNGLNVLELWHGDTLAFKDLAMTCTLEFMNYFLKKRKRHFISIVVTSGDTGSSAMYASRDSPNIDLIVLYPHNRISELQETMMKKFEAKNVHVYAVDGSSDEIDVAMTKILTDHQFVRSHNIGTMNSMNWCRIMVQIAHHIFGYLQTTSEVAKPVDIIIPCGGCGNIAALMLAREMGASIRPVAVCNKNDTFHLMLRTNNRIMKDVKLSKAPAMDISFAQNIERVVWLISGRDGNMIKDLMENFMKSKTSQLSDSVFRNLSSIIRSSVANDNVIIKTIEQCWKENEYHICPHTATAVAHYYGLSDGYTAPEKAVPTLCIATASAAKFAEVLEEAGIPTCKSEKLEVLRNKDDRAEYVPRNEDWENLIRTKVISLSNGM